MLTLTTDSDKKYRVNPIPFNISIPLHFNGPQPNSYGVDFAQSKAFEGGGFIGDVRRGGSCNFEIYTFIPHCNGTHTECVGHITKDRISIHERLNNAFIPATLITVSPRFPHEVKDTYNPDFNAEDCIIDKVSLETALDLADKYFLNALVIRTLPNPTDKKSRDYTQYTAPFFSIEAMEYIRTLGVKHLLIDTPSVDRMLDEGKLTAHHIYFEIPEGEHNESKQVDYTITEFVWVPDEVSDGIYLLNLQIAPFMSDASPSRPQLFSLSEVF